MVSCEGGCGLGGALPLPVVSLAGDRVAAPLVVGSECLGDVLCTVRGACCRGRGS